MTNKLEHISVCICTYKRPELLKRTLEHLEHQDSGGLFRYSIVVADNDRLQSAKQTVLAFALASTIETTYCMEPEQNIALARNKALQQARGDYVAWIDDDEFPAKDWLLQMLKACKEHGADGVLGPVKPFFEQEPPKWLVRGRFCDRPEHPTGSVLDWRRTRTGNVLFRRQILRGIREPFRRQFGNGGEDQEFFRRMMQAGRVFTWCNEAVVYEVVPPERWKRGYLLKKALLRGQNEKHLADHRSIAKSMIAVPLYACLLPFLLLLGQHLFMKCLISLLDHTGKLLGILGLRPMGDKYLSG